MCHTAQCCGAGGRYVAVDMYEAGGIGLVARELVGAGLVHEGQVGVDGKTLEEIGAGLARHGLPGEAELWRAVLASAGPALGS